MKRIILTAILGLAFQPSPSWAQAQQQDTATFMQDGFNRAVEDLVSIGKDVLPQDSSCPEGGKEVLPDLYAKSAGLMSSAKAIDDVIDAVKPMSKEKEAENNKCGSCKQINVVSPVATVAPQSSNYNPDCEGRPAQSFNVNLKDVNEIKNFTQDLLQGKNSEGQRLGAGCPDPCSYYVTTAHTKLPNGSAHLTLTVQCGQPKKGGIFSATYNFKSGLVHQWSCTK